MISWFKRLLTWQQIGLVAATLGVVAVAAVTLSGGDPYIGSGEAWITVVTGSDADSGSQPPGGDTPTSASDPGGEAGTYTGGYAGTYHGSFPVLE